MLRNFKMSEKSKEEFINANKALVSILNGKLTPEEITAVVFKTTQMLKGSIEERLQIEEIGKLILGLDDKDNADRLCQIAEQRLLESFKQNQEDMKTLAFIGEEEILEGFKEIKDFLNKILKDECQDVEDSQLKQQLINQGKKTMGLENIQISDSDIIKLLKECLDLSIYLTKDILHWINNEEIIKMKEAAIDTNNN